MDDLKDKDGRPLSQSSDDGGTTPPPPSVTPDGRRRIGPEAEVRGGAEAPQD